MSQTPQNIQNEGVRENDFELKTTLVNTDRIRITTTNDNYNMTWAVFKDVSGWNAREQRIQQLEQQVDELIDLGGIEDSGSNSNGRYIKFSDGTQICWHTVSFTATFAAWGTLFAHDHKTKFTYPSAFIAKPNINVTNSSQNAAAMIITAKGDATGITHVSLARPTINNGTYSIDYVAIGRWK